ncbi:spermine oxidase-like [Trichogramma pretiosum]|uniref:spermine oxidase-like n=1 Tax=Trichogramma pretiosum TaxID=7493 RepID=UPI0006C9E4FE|nr:spermine oxidase-like [Trichogramma pretiosum]XP_023317133.1 spermine oxidase-like [Trichogramma pretiosum]
MSNEPKILIIGAGAAGIAAASRLLQRGFKNVTILEAKDRIGGRIHTVEFGKNFIELGAQWCHGEKNNIVYDLASPHNLLESSKNIHDHSRHIFVDANGEVIPQNETKEIKRIYYKILDDASNTAHEPKTNFGDYFTNQFHKEIKHNTLISEHRAEKILDWMHKYENSIDCCDTWFELSATRLKEYWECDGDPLLNWKTLGYNKIFDLLTNNYPDPKKRLPVLEKILFNKEVSQIDYSYDDKIIVTTSDKTNYIVDSVIFTGSLGVLKENHQNIFHPSLSLNKIKAIENFNIGVADKIFLEFPNQWWPEKTGAICIMWSEEQKQKFLETYGQSRYWMTSLFLFFAVDYQPQILSGWLVGPAAKHVESLSDEEIVSEFYFMLKKCLGHIYDIPEPTKMKRSKWFSDKHIRGSYSYRSLKTEESDVQAKDLSDPIKKSHGKPVVLFAGEATHEHYFSTVHGAIETGFREANRLIEYYKCLKPHL